MKNRLYPSDELAMVAAMVSDMLKSRETFQKNHHDMRGAHEWLKDTLNVIGRENQLKIMEGYMKRVSSTRVRQVRKENAWANEAPLAAEVKETTEWSRAVMQQRNGAKYGSMLTFWIHLYEPLPTSWTRDIPNRFHFAEVSPGNFQFVGHDYPL
jgi:hypothetical protein